MNRIVCSDSVAGRRYVSSDLPVKPESVKKIWFSDPSTYPIIGVVFFACGLCAVFSSTKLLTSPDVRISQARKNSPVRL
jgi:NADH-ubiquinone reductase complex 1 MLRQ subunit